MAPNPMAKAQDVAQELNMNTRFGRMEMAIERVAAKEREEWMKRHKAWGGKIRIADTEMAGVRLPTESEAEVSVRVAWYRSDEQELRSTLVKQKFKDVDGSWQLVGETRTEGDFGLLGEPVPKEPPPAEGAPPKRAHFPVVRIGAED